LRGERRAHIGSGHPRKFLQCQDQSEQHNRGGKRKQPAANSKNEVLDRPRTAAGNKTTHRWELPCPSRRDQDLWPNLTGALGFHSRHTDRGLVADRNKIEQENKSVPNKPAGVLSDENETKNQR
jgi:hypothetical protein